METILFNDMKTYYFYINNDYKLRNEIIFWINYLLNIFYCKILNFNKQYIQNESLQIEHLHISLRSKDTTRCVRHNLNAILNMSNIHLQVKGYIK